MLVAKAALFFPVQLFSKGTDSYICGCGIATAPTSTRRMLQ